MPINPLTTTPQTPFSIPYGKELEEEISKLTTLIETTPAVTDLFPHRWLALQLLEQDENTIQKLSVLQGGLALQKAGQEALYRLTKIYGEDVDITIADKRYGWINGLIHEVVRRSDSSRLTTSDRIDSIVTHRTFGIPIFLVLMWIVFKLTADVSAPFLDWVDAVINGPIVKWVSAILGAVGLGETWVESLLVDGVIAGVGGVLVFVPVLMFLYLALAVLEDSGYMGRAAFVMDRMMNLIGLQGKSFLPMLVGFGCTVPAIYATRTIENERDRILTGLLVPFMSCGARLPVYVLFAAIFFPAQAGLLVFGMYLLGILTAILLGLVMKRTLFRSKESSAFVMELPPYRIPTLRGIWRHMWERTSAFLKNAWTIIMAVSLLLWLLMSIPVGGQGKFADVKANHSLFAFVSRSITPAFSPLGFGTWEATSALVTGFVAKEVIVSTMSQVYNTDPLEGTAEGTTFFEDLGDILAGFVRSAWDTVKSIPLIFGVDLTEPGEENQPTLLMEAIRNGFDQASGGHPALAGLSYMVFVLIYTPCMVAVAAEKQELGTKWMWFSVLGQLGLAWAMSFIVFQGGLLLGFG